MSVLNISNGMFKVDESGKSKFCCFPYLKIVMLKGVLMHIHYHSLKMKCFTMFYINISDV